MKKLSLLACYLLLLSASASSQVISTIAGNGIAGFSGDGGPAPSASFYTPEGICNDAAGNIYVTDFYNYRVRKIAPTGIISTFAGCGCTGGVYSGDGGPAGAAGFKPLGVAADAAGNIYITDESRVRIVNTLGIIHTFAGTAVLGYSGDGGAATAAQLSGAYSVAVDGSGNVFIGEAGRVRKVTTAGIISTVAGTGAAGYNGDGIPATSAQINTAAGLAIDTAGNLYISDAYNNRIRKVDPAGYISTIAGDGTAGYSGDGLPGTSAELNLPYGVAADSAGNVYISDYMNARVRKLAPSGIITTLAGTGTVGFSGDGGPAFSAEISGTHGIGVQNNAHVFVADNDNQRVRLIYTSLEPIAGATLLCTGDTTQLYELIPGGSWSSSNPAVAAINATSGRIAGVTAGTATITYTLGTMSTTASVSVNTTPGLTSTLSPTAICDSGFITYVPASTLPGTGFTWLRTTVAGILEPPASGVDTFSSQFINTSAFPAIVPIYYTLAVGGCTRTEIVNVTVNPTPTLYMYPPILPVCDSATFTYTPTCFTPGVTYAWSRPATTGIANAPATGIANPSEDLINTTPLPVAVSYVYTLTANGCSNSQAITVTVNPDPILSSPLTEPDICDTIFFNYTPASLTPGTTFAWKRNPVPGIITTADSGTSNIHEHLRDTTGTSPVIITYYFTLKAYGCTSSPQPVLVKLDHCAPADVPVTGPASSLVSLFPNPANTQFTISIGGMASHNSSVEIYNLEGQVVQSQQFDTNSVNLSVEGYTPGIYVCKISFDGLATYKRLLKL